MKTKEPHVSRRSGEGKGGGGTEEEEAQVGMEDNRATDHSAAAVYQSAVAAATVLRQVLSSKSQATITNLSDFGASFKSSINDTFVTEDVTFTRDQRVRARTQQCVPRWTGKVSPHTHTHTHTNTLSIKLIFLLYFQSDGGIDVF